MSKSLLIRGHALEALRALPDESVHCVVTSPPYFGLRDYQTPPVAWGDGWRGHLGLEPTPEHFIAHLVEVFHEVRRVLRSDGTAFVVLGDSYAGSWGSQGHRETPATLSRNSIRNHPKRASLTGAIRSSELQPGDLQGIPWRFAFAAQADGWLLRSGIVWAKRSCMPESVSGTRWEQHRVKVAPCSAPNTGGIRGVRLLEERGGWTPETHPETRAAAEWQDCPGCERCAPHGGLILRRGSWRPTSAHEFIFMLAKSGDYFADGEELREADTGSDHPRHVLHKPEPSGGVSAPHRGIRPPGGRAGSGRNLRSAWELGPEPLTEAHYASFPSEIPRRCILAGTSSGGCCAECGAPWARVVGGRRGASDRALGFRAICSCGAGAVPCTVVDPFAGSGTTGRVARQLGRRFIGIDLSAAYLFGIARWRIAEADPDAILAERPRLRMPRGPLFDEAMEETGEEPETVAGM